MLFVELRFFLFFGVVIALYWRLKNDHARKLLLLAASYLFYAAWDWRFLGLIWFSTVMDYAVGRALVALRGSRWRVRLLALSIAINLGILFVFKYYNFFVAPLAGFSLRVILPVGISFYTFETISYTVDVYRGAEPARSLLDFALFLAFFPHLVAGPILRPSEFLPQLAKSHLFGDVDVRTELMRILTGFVKKACIADQLAPFVDQFFQSPSDYGTRAAWTGVLFWAVQVYCDFSGYCDIALGSAGLLGYRLVPNFDAPYLSPSLAAFWRRWHISLSRFLRDYLYIPLGGNRGSRWLTYRNLLLTLLLGGLWHGAAWHFVLWGGVHGIGLIVERSLRLRPPRWLGVATTFLFCLGALVIFRASSLQDTWTIARELVGAGVSGQESPAGALALVIALGLLHVLLQRYPTTEWWKNAPAWRFAARYGAAWALVLPCMQLGYHPFIYFQF